MGGPASAEERMRKNVQELMEGMGDYKLEFIPCVMEYKNWASAVANAEGRPQISLDESFNDLILCVAKGNEDTKQTWYRG